MKTYEARITPRGTQPFTIRVNAVNSFEAKWMMEGQFPGALIQFFKEIR
ncbi:hypothetical protein [Rufibacter tibetensis]|nr:hypothetical protein [Rufibacter tibetensis]